MKHSQADVSAAERDLGYRPKVSVEEGLKLTIDWFMNRPIRNAPWSGSCAWPRAPAAAAAGSSPRS